MIRSRMGAFLKQFILSRSRKNRVKDFDVAISPSTSKSTGVRLTLCRIAELGYYLMEQTVKSKIVAMPS